MVYNYKTKFTCSKSIHIEINDKTGLIDNVVYEAGCNGNGKGISRLVQGQDPKHIIDVLMGTKCGKRPTSCPEQLAIALQQIQNGELQPAEAEASADA